MSTFSAFRSVTVEFLHQKTRPLPSCLSGSSSHSVCNPRTIFISRATRHSFHTSTSRSAWVKNTQSSKLKEAREEQKARERKRKEIGLRDNGIPYRQVQVVTREGLSPFRPLNDVVAEVDHLNSLDGPGSKKRYHAQLIANEPDPIVKIIDFKAEFKKQKEMREKAKNNAAQKVRKEVQLTWVSSEADVETKLGKMKEDLEKGYKVDLAITPRKGVRAPRLEDMKQRARELVAYFSGIAKEWKEGDFTRSTAVIYLQGMAPPSTEVKKEVEGVPMKIILKEQRRQKEAERLRKKQEREAELERGISETYNTGLPP